MAEEFKPKKPTKAQEERIANLGGPKVQAGIEARRITRELFGDNFVTRGILDRKRRR